MRTKAERRLAGTGMSLTLNTVTTSPGMSSRLAKGLRATTAWFRSKEISLGRNVAGSSRSMTA
jgi:hypothetical protein